MPNQIIDSIENNKLVIFAGAGVSMGDPTNLPDFNNLTINIARGSGNKFDSATDTPERFLGELEKEGVPVQKMAIEQLNEHTLQPNQYHKNIVELFPENDIRIVTTNYDFMFEEACKELGISTKTYTNPAFPRGENFNGIVHLHGDVENFQHMILTDADFGRAYMLHGEASTFLSQLFNSDYTVLFVGYSYNDTVLRYFTRALPDLSGEMRYIFSNEGERESHEILGLTPIIYESGDYKNLYRTIREIGEFSNRNSSSWEDKIIEISLTDTSDIDLTISGEIKYIFNKKYLLEQFLDKVDGMHWFNYLYENNYFNFLFLENSLSHSDVLIMKWILNKFVKGNCEEIITILLKHNNEIKNEFIVSLLKTLSVKKISREALQKILNLVDYYDIDNYTIYDLIIKLNSYELFDKEIVNLFQRTLIFEYSFVKPYIQEDEDEYKVQISVESDIVKQIWELIKTKDINYETIAETVTNELTDLENKSIIGKVEHNFSPYNSFLDDSGYIDDRTYYIKFFIELLTKISDVNSNYIKNWIQKHVNSDLSILRRISIYLINYLVGIPAIDKLDFIEEKIGIFSLYEKEEIFSVIKNEYPKLTLDQQNLFVKDIMNYNFKNENEIEERTFKRSINYSKFNMLVWLKKSDEKNELVLKSIEEIKELYPDFKERDYPDRNVGPIMSAIANQNITITSNYFLENDIEDYFSSLLNYEGDGFEQPDRYAILSIVSEAIGEEFNLGVEFSKKLLNMENYDIDLWGFILKGFEKHSIDSTKFILIYKILSPEIIKNYTYNVAQVLRKYSTSITVDEYHYSKDEVYKILDTILEYSKPFKGSDTETWVNKALNTSYGVVTESLVNIIFLLNKNRNKNDYHIDEELKYYIDSLMDNPKAGEAQTVLYINFKNLKLLDSTWVDEKLVPNFISENDNKFNISWQGYLTDSSFDTKISKTLEHAFLFGIKNISRISATNFKKRFIHIYTLICIYSLEDPLLTYIPGLYKYSSEFVGDFYKHLVYRIKAAERSRKELVWSKWLKRFINNRIDNIPNSYDAKEAYWILLILAEYHFKFDDVENVINNMKKEIEDPIKLLLKLKDMNINDENIKTLQLILTFCLTSIFEDEEKMIDSLSKKLVVDIVENINDKGYGLDEDLVEISKSLNIDFSNE